MGPTSRPPVFFFEMFPFTIRDILWLITVVAVAIAGWMHRTLWEGRANAAAQALQSAGYSSSWCNDGVLVNSSRYGIRKDAVLFRSSGSIEDPESDQETTIAKQMKAIILQRLPPDEHR